MLFRSVKAESGLYRGTLSSLEAACKRVLGVSPFTIEERTAANGTEDAYHLNVIVGTGQASQALYNAINETKPAGLWYTILEVKNAWIQAGLQWNEVAGGLKWSEAKEGNV